MAPTKAAKVPANKAATKATKPATVSKSAPSSTPSSAAKKTKSFDPFAIGTIEDSEDEGKTYGSILSKFDVDEDSDAEAAAAKKKKQSSTVKPVDLNPDFTFELSGGDLDTYSQNTKSYWDFKAAKAAVKGASQGQGSNEDADGPKNTIEDMIERKRKELKEKKKSGAKKAVEVAKAADEEEPEVEDMGDVHMDANGNFIFENESGDDDDDDDDDMDLDIGIKETDQDDEDGADDNDDDEEYAKDLDTMEEDSADELSGEEDQVTVAPKKSQQELDDESDESDDETNKIEDIVNEKRKAEFFAPAPEMQEKEDATSTETFTNFRLSRPILKAISDMGYTKPTPIQTRSIPLSLQAHDLCVSAQTGSGKTLAFLVPIIERLLFRPKDTPTTRVLILVPTRELGVQCHSVALKLSKFTDISWSLCVGGLSTKVQELELRQRPDGVIATPGRLIDHIRNSQGFSLDGIEILVIDEADRILEDGFADELDEIIKSTPKSRQSMLFSATMTDKIEDLTKLSLNRPIRLFVNKATALTSRLTQEFVRVRAHKEESKPAMLLALCSRTYKEEVVIFFRSKAAAHYMMVLFGLCGLKAAELHGNLTQLQRLESLEAFRDQKANFLLCTDLASRGLDIPGIKTVINYDMPKSYSTYVHRCGRTARANQSGIAVSFVGESDRAVLKMAMKASTDEIQHRVIPGKVVTRFEVKVEEMKPAAAEVLQEEKKEKEMRGLEMKVKKMENMVEFADDIKNRPKKSWFQTTAEKEASKQLGKDKHNEDMGSKPLTLEDVRTPIKRGKFDGLSRHKRRMRMAKEEDKKEMAAATVAARSAKKASRPGRITTIPDSSKPAAKSNSGPQKKKSSFASEASGVRGKKKSSPSGSGSSSKMGAKSGSGVAKKKISNKKFKSLGKHKRR